MVGREIGDFFSFPTKFVEGWLLLKTVLFRILVCFSQLKNEKFIGKPHWGRRREAHLAGCISFVI